MPENDRIQTGISGLDQILCGGIPRGNVILVEGTPGTGKTLMGLEFIYRGITEFGESGMIIVFEAAPYKLVRDARGFNWDLEDLQRRDHLKIVFTSPQVLSQELLSPDSLLLEAAAEIGARRIFIDSISLLRTVSTSPGGTNGDGGGSYRALLHQLIEGLHREDLSAMLSHEVMALHQQAESLEIAEYLADTVILLGRERRQRGVHRSLEVVKSRGQDFDGGQHTLRLTSGIGLEVFRRIHAPPRSAPDQPTSAAIQSFCGAAPLDALIGGGVFAGSTTMISGASGSGKTVFGVQILLAGARQGLRGLLVSLDEHPAQMVRNARTLGLDLDEQLAAGRVRVLHESPQELEIDVHCAQIIRAIEEHKIERLVIDGMTAYRSALRDQHAFRDFFHSLVAFCKQRSVTSCFSYENPDLFGVDRLIPDFGVSSVVDNIVLLNFVELGNRVHRGITVTKARGRLHPFVTHEFQVGPGGLELIPLDGAQPPPKLSFQDYFSLLSRAPTRFSPEMLPRGGTERGGSEALGAG